MSIAVAAKSRGKQILKGLRFWAFRVGANNSDAHWLEPGRRTHNGFSTGIAWVATSRGISSTRWYDGQLGARYYLGQDEPSQSWVDATCGAMLAVERLQTYQADTGVTVPKHSILDWAPAASFALGHDAEIVRGFGLAPELRVSFYGLSHAVGILRYEPQTKWAN